MLIRGLLAGTLLVLAASGCAAVVSSVPLVVKPADRISIINLKTVESVVDKSLQDTVAISFVPPRAMPIENIEYRVNGRKFAEGEFDIVLETDKLPVGQHIVNLYARGDGSIVQGTTQLTIIESGLEPGVPDGADGAASSTGTQAQQPHQTAGRGSAASTRKSGMPQFAGDGAAAKARVGIRIKFPDE